MRTMTLTSPDLEEAQPMPSWTGHGDAGGEDRSPSLSWSGAPDGTRSYAITCFDLDEPTGVGFVHWVLFNVAADVHGLEAGAGADGKNPRGSELGFTDLGVACYSGPAPEPGGAPHRYQFRVAALDVDRLDLEGRTTTYAMLQFMTRGHVLASGTLTPIFQTPATQ